MKPGAQYLGNGTVEFTVRTPQVKNMAVKIVSTPAPSLRKNV